MLFKFFFISFDTIISTCISIITCICIFVKISNISLITHIKLTFCQIGADLGFESTSHIKDTCIPSRIGKPKPGSLDMANEGVSAINHIQ